MIVNVNKTNQNEFNSLCNELWHGATIDDCLKDAKVTKQFMYKTKNKFVGFLTCSIRKEFVLGCSTNKVAYIEGIYVLPEFRRKYIATKLVEHFEKWATKHGCEEIASDIEISNDICYALHQKLGYKEVERSIHFRKGIKGE